jgi:hydroxysqualene synthase
MNATPEDMASGKGHRDENFPVGSFLIAKRHRPVVMAFYRVARMADDVADHPTASAEEKLRQLDDIEAGVTGASLKVPAAVALRNALAEHGQPATHIRDLLTAFRRDVTQTRYADWADLMDYCRYSAAPVGRFLLDVHDEPKSNWPLNDALCAALQVNNHLQDCGKDYRALDRVYLPADLLARHGASVGDLAAPAATPGLRAAIAEAAELTSALLAQAKPFARRTHDRGLCLEIGVVHAMAEDINRLVRTRDPLSERVHLRPWEMAWSALKGVASATSARAALGRGRK